ncbi:hypothetical protein ACTJJZ_16675 [Microbacterium sp. 22242]
MRISPDGPTPTELWDGVVAQFDRINPGQSIAKVLHERSVEDARRAFLARTRESFLAVGREWELLGDTAVFGDEIGVRFGPGTVQVMRAGEVLVAGAQTSDWAALVLAFLGERRWGVAWADAIRRREPALHLPIDHIDASDALGEPIQPLQIAGPCRWVIFRTDTTPLCWAISQPVAELAASALELGAPALRAMAGAWPEPPSELSPPSGAVPLARFPAPRVGIEGAWWLSQTTPFRGLFWRGGHSAPKATTFPRLRAVSTDVRVATENFTVPFVSAFLTGAARDARYRSRFPENQEFALLPDAQFIAQGEPVDVGGIRVAVFADTAEETRPAMTVREVLDEVRRAQSAPPIAVSKPRWFVDGRSDPQAG